MTIYEILTELKTALETAGTSFEIKLEISQTVVETILATNKGNDTIFINCNGVNALTRFSENNGAFYAPQLDIFVISKNLDVNGFPSDLTDETELVFDTLTSTFGQCGNILFNKYSGNYYYARFSLTYLKA